MTLAIGKFLDVNNYLFYHLFILLKKNPKSSHFSAIRASNTPHF